MTNVHRKPRSAGRTLVTVLALGGLLLAACGSDDDATDDSSPAASSPAASSPSESDSTEPTDSVEETTPPETSDESAETTPVDTASDEVASDEIPCDVGPAAGESVKIAVAWVDGPAVAIPELGEAATAAVDYANECLGGIGGHEIEIVPCKIDETNPASATECANTAIEEGAVAMVVTITSQGQTLVPAVTAAGIPYITSTGVSAAESIDSTGKVFTLTGGVPSSLGAMALDAKAQGITKVAVIIPDNAAAAVGGLIAIPFGNAGIEYEVVTVPAGTADMTPQVSAAVSNGAQAITMFGSEPFCIGFLNATAAVAADIPRWITGTCGSSEVTDVVGADVLDGTVLYGGADQAGDDPELAEYRAVMAKYAPDTTTSGFSPAGYQAVMGLVRGVADIGEDVTAETITTTMKATKDVPLTSGYGLTFSCSEQPLPPLTVCGGLTLVSDMDGTKPVNTRLVDAAPVFTG